MPWWKKSSTEESDPGSSASTSTAITSLQRPAALYAPPATLNDEPGTLPPPFPLPFFKAVELPKGPEGFTPVAAPNPQENCVGKSFLGGIMGAGLGVMMGIFLGAMGDMSPAIPIVNGREAPQAPATEQLRIAYRATFDRCGHWARNFMVLTALFGGVECVVEKYRGKHDSYNGVISGCGVGAALSARGGPQAACIGCVGFAAFSAVMEAVMGGH